MVSLYLWPRPIKRIVFVVATLLVAIVYASLCSGLFALAGLFT